MRIVCLATAFLLAAAATAGACETIVRDAAFRGQRDVHRLCVIANADDKSAASIVNELTMWLDGPASDLNVELIRVNADDPAVRWTDYAIPSAPPTLPVVVFVGRNNGTGESFLVHHWEPSPTQADLDAIATSPLRQRLQYELSTKLAVILYAPTSGSDGVKVEAMLQARAAKWSDGALGPLSVRTIDRNDAREQIVHAFAGLTPSGPDWVGIVFGRGKLMAPPLVGDEISAERLDELIGQIVEQCSCSKPLQSIGIDMPMAWPASLDAALVLARDASGAMTSAEKSLLLPSLSAAPGAQAPTAATVALAPVEPASRRGVLVTAALWTIVGVVVLVSVGSIIFLRR